MYNWLLNEESLVMLTETLLSSVGDFSSFAGLTGEFHFLWIRTISFDEFPTIMAKEDNSSSVRIKGYFFLSIGRDIHKIALDTVESSIFLFWSRGCRGLSWFRHRGEYKYKIQNTKDNPLLENH